MTDAAMVFLIAFCLCIVLIKSKNYNEICDLFVTKLTVNSICGYCIEEVVIFCSICTKNAGDCLWLCLQSISVK